MKKKGSTFILVLTVMLFSIAVTLAALAVFMRTTGRVIVNEGELKEEEDYTEYDKLLEMDEIISNSFLGKFDRNTQMDGVFRAMMDGLGDKYSRYLDKEELKQLGDSLNSSFTGTGIVLIDREDEEGYLITEVVSGGPADIAGIKEGDIILKVDGKTFGNIDDIVEYLKGDPGTEVKLYIQRGEENLNFSLVRGDIRGASVETKTLEDKDKGDIGYIKIKTFGDDTASQFDAALSSFERNNVKGVIIDLRDNPGGIFDQGVKVADRILPESTITYTLDRNEEKENFNSDSNKTNLNLVLLINENTASTAEMMAAALKGSSGCKLVGVMTYGKGLIQETHMFSDGTAINITIKEFYAPDGTRIDGQGVTPDITVRDSGKDGEDNQLDRARELLFDFNA